MKKLLYILILLLSINAVVAENYKVYRPENLGHHTFDDADEKVLFIMDYSGSMSESIGRKKKVDMMLSTMAKILPTINKRTWVGLRVYGNKMGFTAYDACKASSLLVPIGQASAETIAMELEKTSPKGMTPITYSLKKAVESDFIGFQGKKHIILLTDGGENCDESPCVWAMELIKLRKDVKIDVIAFNIENGEDIDQLECTALVTSGKFYTAKTAAELANSLKKSLNTRKQVEAKIISNP